MYMKKVLPILTFLVLLLGACQEQEVEIPCLSCDTTNDPVDPQDRVVLVEEFTGVRCVNCPQGAAEIENLLSVYGERLVAVSIHAGFFADPPLPESQYDFTTDEGDQILDLIGEPFGYPAAVIDRYQFDNENTLTTSQQSWGGHIAERLQEEVPITVNIDKDYDASSRQLDVTITLGTLEDLTGQDVRLSIMITENNVEDAQLTPDQAAPVLDYKHKHVLRDMLGPYDGIPLTDGLSNGQTTTLNQSITLPDNWVASNCEIVAFAHLSNAGTQEILQAAHTKVAN